MSGVYSVSKVFALQGGSPSFIPKIHNKKKSGGILFQACNPSAGEEKSRSLAVTSQTAWPTLESQLTIDCLPLPHRARITGEPPHSPGIYVGSADLNSGPLIYIVSILTAEPSPLASFFRLHTAEFYISYMSVPNVSTVSSLFPAASGVLEG